MMQDAPQAKFKLRDLSAETGEDCVGLESDIPLRAAATYSATPPHRP